VVAKESGATLVQLQQLLEKNRQSVEYKDSVYTNVIQVLDYVEPGKVTPLEYNEEKIREIIISRRKQELISNLQRDILNDALNNNKLKITEENEKNSH
jgi:hypothetical protein